MYPVLATGGRAYVILGPAKARDKFEARIGLDGGFVLGITQHSGGSRETFTLVGPAGTCVGHASVHADLGIDYGGSSSASLPGPTHEVAIVEGCDDLAQSPGLLVALDGADESASWQFPSHLDDQAVPADRALAEDEVWIHRYGFAGSDVNVVERTVVRYSPTACHEEDREVIVETEDGHPLSNHAGFLMRGALRTRGGMLLVLVGSGDREALRVVDLDEARSDVHLDARFALLGSEGWNEGC